MTNIDIHDFQFSQEIKKEIEIVVNSYQKLYIFENILREYIEIRATNEFGEDWESKINIKNEIKNKILNRKENEEKNRWLNPRGKSDLFYCDFIDIKSIFINNWELFKKDFPSQDFIVPKLIELYEIRNCIAHNGHLNQNAINVLETYRLQIYSQLNFKMDYIIPTPIIKSKKLRHPNSVFEEFQELVFKKNFKPIISEWKSKYSYIFPNGAFDKQFHTSIGNNIILVISNNFNNSSITFKYYSKFQSEIRIISKTVKDTDENYINFAIDFFNLNNEDIN